MYPAPEASVIESTSLQPLARRARREEPAVDVAREVILQVLSAGHPPIEAVAAVANTSGRTLQRRLALSGRTYKKLVDEVRLAAARKALVASDAPLKAIAFELGFAEQASFTRAFRRWTGQAPSQYRKRQRRLERGWALPSVSTQAGVVRPWCQASDCGALRWDLTRQMKVGLKKAGCSIPYPQQDVHHKQGVGAS